jgi:transcription elongation factor GreA
MSTSTKLQLTPEGLEQLEKELKERIEVTRKKLQDDLDSELGDGDLSENTSYYRVQEEIGSNQRRIEEIQSIISRASLTQGSECKTGDGATIGCSVTIRVRDRELTYAIVGSTEADPSQNKISVDSPLGKALVGKKKGEKASVKTPVGNQEYEIIAIS